MTSSIMEDEVVNRVNSLIRAHRKSIRDIDTVMSRAEQGGPNSAILFRMADLIKEDLGTTKTKLRQEEAGLVNRLLAVRKKMSSLSDEDYGRGCPIGRMMDEAVGIKKLIRKIRKVLDEDSHE